MIQNGMILIGMFDSPFVRRVAVSLDALGIAFEHRNWSVGRDFERIREFSPLGRVPVLVLASGESLIESAMILDHLDEWVGAQRALMPASGEDRRAAQRLIAFATGAAEKAIQIVGERVFRPAEKHHEPYLERCRLQMRGALAEIERACVDAGDGDWLIGDRMTQADITLACHATYIREAVPQPLTAFPALAARNARHETMPLFARYHLPFDAPVPA